MNPVTVPPGTNPEKDGLEAASVNKQLMKTFSIVYTSKMDGQVYDGQFTTKKLSIRGMGQVGVRKSQLNGGYFFDPMNPGSGIDETTDATNNMIAHFEVCLLQSPDWFNLDEVYDIGLLGEIYKHIIEFENSFFRSTRSAQEVGDGASGSTDRQAAEPQPGNAGSVKAVGREQVQPTLDP
jgi:hypothetical protein